MSRKIRYSIEPAVECIKIWVMVFNISRNPGLAEMEIRMIREENRNLLCQLARVVLLDAMDKDGAVFPDGIVGNQLKQVVRIMDGFISGMHCNQVQHRWSWIYGNYIPSTLQRCMQKAVRALVV